MKLKNLIKGIIIVLCFTYSMGLSAQVSKTINLTIAGTLKNQNFGSTPAKTIVNFALTGKIDARDIQFMRDSMSVLAHLDMSETTIEEYSGLEGTYPATWGIYDYPANELPPYSFYNLYENNYASSIVSIVLPSNLESIKQSFYCCKKLISINIPANVSNIASSSFTDCILLNDLKVDAENNYYKAVDNVLFSKDGTELISYLAGKTNTSYIIPEGVIIIKESAFVKCENLNTVQLSKDVTTISYSAFWGCENLNSIIFSTGLKNIEKRAFEGCGFTSLILPTTLETIGSSFGNCDKLTTVSIPANVFFIAPSAFSNCSLLRNLTVDNNNKYYKTIDNVLFSKDGTKLLYYAEGKIGDSYTIPTNVTCIENSAFSGCFGLKSILLPFNLLAIENHAFSRCNGLTSIVLPGNLTSIGESAFWECSGLTEIINLNPNPIEIDASVFANVNKTTCRLKVSNTARNKYKNTLVWKDFFFTTASGYVVNASLNNPQLGSINGLESRFYSLNETVNLTAVPKSNVDFVNWTSIDGTVISTNPNLTFTLTKDTLLKANFQRIVTINLTIAGSLKDELVDACSVTKLILSGSIDARDIQFIRDSMPIITELDMTNATIEYYAGTDGTRYGYYTDYQRGEMPVEAFETYEKEILLTSILLPTNLTSIGYSAFENCNKLTSLVFPTSLLYINGSAFRKCTKLTTIEIPENVFKIGGSVFSYCSSLNSITVSANSKYYKAIDNIIFSKDGTKLVYYLANKLNDSYTIPEGVLSIEDNAFYSNKNLSSIAFSSSLISIGTSAFESCSELLSVNFPNNLTIIGVHAFNNCSKLTTIHLPTSLKTIEYVAFAYCNNLTTITNLNPNPIGIEASVFESVDQSRCTLKVSDNAVANYQAAEVWKNFAPITGNGNVVDITYNSLLGNVSGVNNEFYTSETTLNLVATPNTDVNFVNWTTTNGELLSTNLNFSFIVTQDTVIIANFERTVTLNLTVAGTLNTITNPSSITKLILTGVIDARDVRFMRDSMPALAELDLSGASIVEYIGKEGTGGVGGGIVIIGPDGEEIGTPTYPTYPANEMPTRSFYKEKIVDGYQVGNNTLKSIILPVNLNSIGENAFYMCNGLQTINLPNSLTSIKSYAFGYCEQLSLIQIPENVSNIGENPFIDCSSLSNLNVDPSNNYYKTIDNVLFSKDGTWLFWYAKGKTENSYTIPEGVINIGSSAFSNCNTLISVEFSQTLSLINEDAFSYCNKLEAITLPKNLTIIKSHAFFECRNLNSITVLNPIPIELDDYSYPTYNVFGFVDKSTCILKVPTSSLETYKNANVWKDFENIVGEGLVVSAYSSYEIFGSVEGIENRFYQEGEIINITATPKEGCKFLNWTTSNGEDVSTNANISFTVTKDTTLVAHFDNSLLFDATLANLTVSEGTLNPTFHFNTTQYFVHVGTTVSTITLNAVPTYSGANVEGAGVKTLDIGENTFYVHVTPANRYGHNVYTVTVIRQSSAIPSNDATLSELKVFYPPISEYLQLTPSFNANTTEYTVNAGNANFVMIYATKNNKNALATGAGSKFLNTGDNVFPIQVLAEDGVTTKTYTLTVIRQSVMPSSDATLYDLTVNGGILNPDFDRYTTEYTVNVANSVDQITLNAETYDYNATLQGIGTKTLNVGSSIFPIQVTAEDGTIKIYTITVVRQSVTPSNDANLLGLTVSSGSLTPLFNANTTLYTVNVENDVNTITLNATKSHTNASLIGTGEQSLNVGNNTFEIQVTAEDGTTKETYTVIVIRKEATLNSDATLKTLSVSEGVLTPAFDRYTTDYSVNVVNSVNEIALNAETSDYNATLQGIGTKTLNVGPSIFPIQVTAEDGTIKIYTITVDRQSVTPSNNANLLGLTVSSGSLTPTFNTDTPLYTVNVENSVNSITLNATKSHSNAIVTGIGEKTLIVGNNNFEIQVTAEDGIAKKIYTVIVIRKEAVALSNDANLLGLTVSSGSLTPIFNTDTPLYTVNVANNISTITLNATKSHSNAIVSGIGEKTLIVGNNNFEIQVTAEDGIAKKTYTVIVIRKEAVALSNDANLLGLTVSSGSLTPIFNTDTPLYTVNVANNISTITLNATKSHSNAIVSGIGEKTLIVGNNSFEIQVTAEDGIAKKTYTVIVIRKEAVAFLSNDANLLGLTVSSGSLTPAFNTDTPLYTVNVENSVNTITLNATKRHSNAIVSGIGEKPLIVGNNSFEIQVTAEDGIAKKTYTVIVIRKEISLSNDANLSGLTVSSGSLTPTFNANTPLYTVNVANNISTITLSATKSHSNAIVTGIGEKPLIVGNNSFEIQVTAEDGTTKKTYKVIVIRQNTNPSNNALLKSLTISLGTFTPNFHADSTSYTLEVEHDIDTINIAAEASHSLAYVNGYGKKVLRLGENEFTIEVVAEDGVTKKVYTITVIRLKNATISTTEDESQFKVYPNPTSNYVYIENSTNKKLEIEVYSIHGKKILYTTGNKVDLRNLPKGMYFIKVNNTTTFRVVKQ